MATRKQTFIFRLCDVEPINDDLNRLVAVLRNSKVSYRAESEDGYYLSVRVFTDERTMHKLLYTVRFGPIRVVQRAIRAARRHAIDRAMGYKPMGSTPATRRSKRSA